MGLDLTGSTWSASEFAAKAKESGVWVSALGPKYVRLVTHLDIDDAGVEKAVEVLKVLLERAFMSK